MRGCRILDRVGCYLVGDCYWVLAIPLSGSRVAFGDRRPRSLPRERSERFGYRDTCELVEWLAFCGEWC